MRMDFEKAEKFHNEVYGLTKNELELLIADIGLMKMADEALSVPVIASGGAGSPGHLTELFTKTQAQGAVISSMLYSPRLERNYTVAIDLGTSNVVVAIGEKQNDDPVNVVSIVSKPVEGVNAGRIDNIELVSRAIGEAVSEVEEQLGIRITEAYAGISGEFVRCARHTDHVFVYDPQNGVNQRDVDALFDRMRNVQAPDDETIMERIPQNYVVDDNLEVKNPVGSFGKKLSSTFNFILCLQTPVQRLDMALKRLGIKMLDAIPNAIATAEAVLSPDEKEEGVAVVDIGGGLTDVAVYLRNVVRYIVTIPMGASAINRDIRTMSVPDKHVESLKQKYGSAVAELAPEDKLIRVNGRTAREAKDILLRNLATVIEARATDIAEFVQQEIKDSGNAGRLAYGVVLTGGSAKLKDLDELFRRVTGVDVRVGSAAVENGLTEQSGELIANHPEYATAIGILLQGARRGSCAYVEGTAKPAAKSPAATPITPFQRPVQPGIQPPRPAAGRHPAQPLRPQPASAPLAEEADGKPTAPDLEEPPVLDSPKKNWGNIFQKAFDKINKSFTAGEDEEI